MRRDLFRLDGARIRLLVPFVAFAALILTVAALSTPNGTSELEHNATFAAGSVDAAAEDGTDGSAEEPVVDGEGTAADSERDVGSGSDADGPAESSEEAERSGQAESSGQAGAGTAGGESRRDDGSSSNQSPTTSDSSEPGESDTGQGQPEPGDAGGAQTGPGDAGGTDPEQKTPLERGCDRGPICDRDPLPGGGRVGPETPDVEPPCEDDDEAEDCQPVDGRPFDDVDGSGLPAPGCPTGGVEVCDDDDPGDGSGSGNPALPPNPGEPIPNPTPGVGPGEPIPGPGGPIPFPGPGVGPGGPIPIPDGGPVGQLPVPIPDGGPVGQLPVPFPEVESPDSGVFERLPNDPGFGELPVPIRPQDGTVGPLDLIPLDDLRDGELGAVLPDGPGALHPQLEGLVAELAARR